MNPPSRTNGRAASAALKEIYDQRYAGDYRVRLRGYEVARWEALRHFLTNVLRLGQPTAVLDYGAGAGLHVPLWELLFPRSTLSFCDISSGAKERFCQTHGARHGSAYRIIKDDQAEFDNASFDLVVSVEVMEHVANLSRYLQDTLRLLKPGGLFVWTTPCANALSVEHLVASLTRQIEWTDEGYRRWRWEDPTHLRRLTGREARAALHSCGYRDVRFRFRAHVFSFVCTYCPPRGRFVRLRERLMKLDYALFRVLPNGASMLGAARKPQ